MLCVFLYCYQPYVLRQHLPLNLEVTSLARLVDQYYFSSTGIPGTHLLSAPFTWVLGPGKKLFRPLG